jgi:hypothetical protein
VTLRRPPTVAIGVPGTASLAEARAAAGRCPLFQGHPFPTCFSCGPDRAPGDGLQIFPGPLPGGDLWAAPWTPDPSVADQDGLVLPEVVWAALDCPIGFAAGVADTVMVLGRMAPGCWPGTVALSPNAVPRPSKVEALHRGKAPRRTRMARSFLDLPRLSAGVEAVRRSDRSMQQCTLGSLLGGRDGRLLLVAVGALLGAPLAALAAVTATSALSLGLRVAFLRRPRGA